LLADAERFAQFFAVKRSAIPANPDSIADAKDKVLALVAASRRAAVREDMTPRAGSGRRVGPAYTSRLIDFASDTKFGWRLKIAMANSPSLAKCIARFDDLLAGHRRGAEGGPRATVSRRRRRR